VKYGVYCLQFIKNKLELLLSDLIPLGVKLRENLLQHMNMLFSSGNLIHPFSWANKIRKIIVRYPRRDEKGRLLGLILFVQATMINGRSP